jgi:FAD synthetase
MGSTAATARCSAPRRGLPDARTSCASRSRSRQGRTSSGAAARSRHLPLDERIARLQRAGADRIVVLPFSKAFAAIPYRVFAEMLTDCLQMRALHVGSDFALGADRAGTAAKLRTIGLDVWTNPLVMTACGGERVSSSSIRRGIARQPRTSLVSKTAVADEHPPDREDWRREAVPTSGSWWPDYIEWLSTRSGGRKPAPKTLDNRR